MNIDHIGFAVQKIDQAVNDLQKLGFCFEKNIIEDISRNIKICFGEKNGYRIELVSPLDGKKNSPVDTYLNLVGPTLYHICYGSDQFEEDIKLLQEQGFKTIQSPSPAVAFEEKRVAFLMKLSVGLLELLEG